MEQVSVKSNQSINQLNQDHDNIWRFTSSLHKMANIYYQSLVIHKTQAHLPFLFLNLDKSIVDVGNQQERGKTLQAPSYARKITSLMVNQASVLKILYSSMRIYAIR